MEENNSAHICGTWVFFILFIYLFNFPFSLFLSFPTHCCLKYLEIPLNALAIFWRKTVFMVPSTSRQLASPIQRKMAKVGIVWNKKQLSASKTRCTRTEILT